MSHVQVRSQNGYDWDVKMIKGEKNISVLNVIYYIIYYIDMNNIAVCWRDCFGLVGLKPNTSINIK